MTGNIAVSVVIPAYNAEATLARALESVLGQKRPAQEIIVVDDASTDATREITRGFGRRGVRTVALPKQRGAGGARNVGIEAATSAWIAFLDADDEWLPAKLQKQLDLLEAQRTNVSFLFCASHEFSPTGRYVGDTYQGRPACDGDEAWKALLACNFVATPTVIARRDLLQELGGFDETLKVAEDQDMWIRLALAGRPVYLPESLVRVHLRTTSLSSWNLADQYSYTIPMVERHLAALRGRLSGPEINIILGERLNRIGSVAAAHGYITQGVAMMLRSAFLGYKPVHNLTLIAKLPLVKLAKIIVQTALLPFSTKSKGKACAQ